jgi:hypothetical protein
LRRDVDAINTFRESAGHFTSFDVVSVVKFRIFAAHEYFWGGFDSWQLHKELAGHSPKITVHKLHVKTWVVERALDSDS